MEPVEHPAVGGAEPVSAPAEAKLEAKHDDLDVLEGCPRKLTIQGVEITQRAWRNHEYTSFASLLLYFGFGDCESEADVDAMSAEDIYNSIAMEFPLVNPNMVEGRSLEEMLYAMMQVPEGQKPPNFYKLTKDECVAFLAMVCEQNNLLKMARKKAKKKILAGRTLSALAD